MKEQDHFEEFVRAAVSELEPAPVVPREEMWTRIDAARRFRRGPKHAFPRWAVWGIGLAAMLALGIGLGRLSVHQAGSINQVPAVALNTDVSAADAPYGTVALQHLGRAEILLTSVNSGTVDPQVQEWATDMLTTTRLLLDSPAANDARMARLLEDLELLLAQIASARGSSNLSELNLIQHGIEYTDVLPRLRATFPAHAAAGT